jgi:GT2 family glycosyltransferase
MPQTIPVQIIINNESAEYIERCLMALKLQTHVANGDHLHVVLLNYQPLDFLDGLKNWCQESIASDRVTVEFIAQDKRAGFGENHNVIREHIKGQLNEKQAPAFLLLNPDTVLDRECIAELWHQFNSNKKAGLVEARQFPSEHPKVYDPKTLQVDWCSCACVLVDSKTFDQMNGFDTVYDMYLEDIDLSWRFWLAGKSCYYNPRAICSHATGLFWSNPYQPNREFAMTVRNHLILIKKFFGHRPIKHRLLMRKFRQLQLPGDIRKFAEDEFSAIAPKIKSIAKSHPRVKAFNLGLYHDIRWELVP